MNITRDQFRLQMDRLVDTFGDKFPEQRELMMWEAVQGLDYHLIVGVIDQLIRTCRNAPIPGDFIEAVNAACASSESKVYKLGEYRPRQITKCLDCGDSGFAHIVRHESQYEEWAKWENASAPCHCQRGRELIEAAKRIRPSPTDLGTQFSDRWKTSYKIIPFYGPEKRKVSSDGEDGSGGVA